MITIINSLAKVSTAAVLLLIVMFIFTLLGMQLFAGLFTEENFDGEKPRAHFDNFWWGFVTVFQVLTGENWNEVLYDGMKVAGFNSVLFFLLLTFIGNYVIFNLFLAILLDQFDQNEDDDNDDSKNARGGSKVTPVNNRTARQKLQKQDHQNQSTKANLGLLRLLQPVKNDRIKRQNTAPSLKDNGIPEGSSLYIFSDTNAFESRCLILLLTHYSINLFFLILLSSIMLVIDLHFVSAQKTAAIKALLKYWIL